MAGLRRRAFTAAHKDHMPRLAIALALLAAACGLSTADQARQASDTASQLQAVVVAYAGSTTASAPGTCAAELEAYRQRATGYLDTLDTMCPGLDACLGGMGHHDDADLSAAAGAMRVELANHADGGCRAADVGAELARHREVMVEHCQHLQSRAGALGPMVGSGPGQMMGMGCH